MRRISVVGASGSGKTTLARRLARDLDLPLIDLDELHHGGALPREEFRATVAELVEGDRWVVDGSFRAVRDLVWDRADTLVWLDLPRTVTVPRLARRTLARALTGREVWHGNPAPLRGLLSRDPERNVLLWAWRKHPLLVEQHERELADRQVVRLRSPREVSRWRPRPANR